MSGFFEEAENGTLHQAYHVFDPFEEKSNVVLTAHVLIALEQVMPNLQGSQKIFVSTAKQRGMTFLEKCLHEIKDDYALSLVTYSLALLKSPQADIAFGLLLSASREDDGKVYWAPSNISANRYLFTFKKNLVY